MQALQKYFKSRLSGMVEVMQDEQKFRYANANLIFAIMLLQRISLLFPEIKFGDSEYWVTKFYQYFAKDLRLILFKDITNWFTFQTPLRLLKSTIPQTLLLYFFGIIHWIALLSIFHRSERESLINEYKRVYYTHYQTLLLIPTLLLIADSYQQNQYLLSNLILATIIIHNFMYYFIQRNYTLPVNNPLHKRYSSFNIIMIFIDIIIITLAFSFNNELVQTLLINLWYLLTLIEAFFIEPFSYYHNQTYIVISSLQSFLGIVKLFAFKLSQDTIFYMILLFVPYLGIIVSQIKEKMQTTIIYQSELYLEKILMLTDILFSHQTTALIKQTILWSLKAQFRLEINEKESVYQQLQQLIHLLFYSYIHSLVPQIRFSYESLFLFKSNLLIKTMNRKQLGYILLKQYFVGSTYQSLYFRIMSEILEKKIKIQSEKSQFDNGYLKVNESKLNLYDIRQIEITYEKSIDQIEKIIDEKQKFWTRLLQGYRNIEQFKLSAYLLSENIWDLKQLVFNKLNIDSKEVLKHLNHLNSLELKLLSLVFSLVLNDFHSTLEIETRMDEILSIERNNNSDIILNTTLLKDELILISTSMVKYRGQILNQNRQAIAQFFEYDNEKEFIQVTHINQLMPNFISNLHDDFINQYLKTGESQLFTEGREVYYQTKHNFIKIGQLSLVHAYEDDFDYIITGSLLKIKESMDLIIFDSSGRIMAITETIFYKLIEDNENSTIDFLLYKSFIYFWFTQIYEILDQEKDQLLQNELFGSSDYKFQNVHPIKNLKQALQLNETYRRQHNWNVSQQSSSRVRSKVNESIEKKTDQSQQQETPDIQKTQFQSQNEKYSSEFYRRMIEEKIVDELSSFKLRYQIQLRLLGKKQVPFFVIQISEITRRLYHQGQSSAGSNFRSQSHFHSQQQDTLSKTVCESSDNSLQIQINESVINKMIVFNEPPILKFNEEFQKQQQQLQQQQQQQQQFELSHDKSKDYVSHKFESNLISPRDNYSRLIINQNEEEQEQEQEEGIIEDNKVKSNSQQYIDENKVDIVMIMKKNQMNIVEDVQERFNKSQSSSRSDNTQTYIYNIVRQLSSSDQYHTSIVKAITIVIFLFLIQCGLIATQLILSRNSITILEEEIPLVRIPDRFNRLYCTFITLGQLNLQIQLLNESYSEYYQYRIKNESVLRRTEMQDLISNSKQQLTTFEASGQLDLIKLRIINEYIYDEDNVTMTNFWIMTNEVTQEINESLVINDAESLHKIQVILQFLKGNLNSQLTLTKQLVEQIRLSFFREIDSNQLNLTLLMIIQLLVIAILIIFQFQYWKEPYSYKQSILLLLSRINETDIEYNCQKLGEIKEQIQGRSKKWKQINYLNQFYYKNFQRAQTMKILTQSSKTKGKIAQIKTTSRIQETQFSLINIFLMLAIIWMLLSSFVIAVFIFQSQNISGSRPELDLCMAFVKFKSDFDGVMILSQLLKNQQILIDETMKSQIFERNPELNTTDKYFKTLYEEMLVQFVELYTESNSGYSSIYQNIISSKKLSTQNINLLLGLYQEDLCNYIIDKLPFCVYNGTTFKYFPTFPPATEVDNNHENFKYGINGIIQKIEAIFKSNYVQELQGKKDTNITQVEQFLVSPEYQQNILAYYFDINKAVVQFYVTIIEASVQILEADYQQFLAFNLGVGSGIFLLYFVIIIWRARTLQRSVQGIRQSLILIPQECLLDAQIQNAIKRFEKNL